MFIHFSEHKTHRQRHELRHKFRQPHDHTEMKENHLKSLIFPRFLDNLLISIVIITISLPEGLPMAVALTLAFSVKKLMDQKNLVRKMHSCETMGGANYICTDKTGTLTKNELNVVKILTSEEEIELEEDSETTGNNKRIKKREKHDKYFKNEKYWNLVRNSISFNVEGSIHLLDIPNDDGDIEEFQSKNKTDGAMANFLYRMEAPLSEIMRNYNEKNIKQIAFDSNKKRMTTFVKEKNNHYRLYTKGAAEYIEKYCKYYINSSTGEKEQLDLNILSKINMKIN